MSDVPTELFRKILLQLPAESLFRLRSVCKTWLRIIDDPCFIKSHTNNQLYNHTLLVRNETGAPLFSFSLDSLKFVQDLQEIDAIRIKQLIRHGVPRLPALFHVASCNGLILISHEDIKKIWSIWNPLTGESRELPQLTNASLNLEGFGFGYDYEADDYKVVRIDRLISDGKFVYQTLVYSLKSDSWSMIEDCVGYTPMPYPGVFLNGTLYWRSWEIIVALDIRTGSYSQLPLPSVYIMDMNIGCHLDALDGCLIFSLNYYNTNLYDGWVMKDNGAEKSWIKLFSLRIFVSPFESQRNFKLVAYLKGKEQVVLQYSRGFVWFDIANNSVLNFSVHCFSRIASSRICPGSLVRLKARGSAVGFETGAKTSTKKRKRNCKKKDASLKICVRGNGDDCCFSDRFCREDLCDCSIEKMSYWDSYDLENTVMLPDVEVEDIEVDNSSVEEHISSEDRSDEDANYVDDNDVPLDDETIWKKTFDTTDEADLFFKEYGKRMGFTTRKCHTDSKNGIIKNMKWECSLAGFRKPPIGGPKSVRRSKPDTRCGCTVCFRVARENKEYKVTMFVSAHNHELQTVKTAKKAKRNISPGNQAVITMMNEVGIKTSQIMDYLKLAEGPSNLTFSNKDAHNFLAKERREFVKHGDATTALCLLDVMKLNDADLVYEKVVGEDGSVNMLFWADGLGRAQYKLFGDALVFDSTYKTNKYKFPLVILSGVDNNMRTCVFGGALIHNETFESYAWLLQTFLRLMGGQAPLSVITDQDAAMHKAIQNVFPKTKHRLCNWHLGRNCMQYVKVPEFCNEFSRLTAQKLSIDDFEETWERITKKHGVAENSWVLETYSKREMWAEAYFKGHFTAMMRSSQRAESMNARFKVRGKQGFNLCEFLKQFFNNLHTLRLAAFEIQRESEHSVKSNNCVALRSFVDHASTVYSKNIRTEVYNEIAKEQALVLAESIELHGGVRKLTFSKFGSSKKKSWSVEIDDVNEKFYCECEKLESTGFPCCHLFSAFKQLGITTIPNVCIRERWTTKIGQQLHVYFTNLFSASDSQRQRFMQLHRECVALCLDASQSASGTEDLMKQFQKAKKSLKDVVSGTSEILDRDETIGEQSKVRDPIRQSQNYGIGNPSKSKPRGAPRNRRQKCGFCRYEGHKITGCPDKKSKEEQEKKSHFTKDNEDP